MKETPKKTKWEKYESKNKDELIIELVKAEYGLDNICAALQEIIDYRSAPFYPEDGEKPPKAWRKKIVDHAIANIGAEEVTGWDLEEYGVGEKTAWKLFVEMSGGEDLEPEDVMELADQAFVEAPAEEDEEVKKGKSKWSLYKSKSKDELIIELVKAEYKLENVCSSLGIMAGAMFECYQFADGEVPPKSWMKKIVEYETRDVKPKNYHICDFGKYGISPDVADAMYEELLGITFDDE